MPMKFTVKDGTFTQNFFYGKGSNDDAKNYILEHLDIPFYNGLGEELTVDQKQKILSKLPPSATYGYNEIMVTEDYVNNIKHSLPSTSPYYACYVINKDQTNCIFRDNLNSTLPRYVFYYGNDYDDKTFSDWVIPSTTKYVELYFDVNEGRYYDRKLTKVYNVTDTNKIRSMSDVTHTVNPDTYETHKDFHNDVEFTCKDLTIQGNNYWPLVYNVYTISYDNKDWLNDVIAGENVKINGETIKYIVNIDDKCYYKAKVEDGKVHLDLNENNWFEYNADLYQLSDVMPKVLFSNSNFSFYRLNNKEIFAMKSSSSSYYKLSSIEFYDWKKNEGLYNGRVSTNGSNSSSFVGTDINFSNIKLCILYKKGTGATFVPRNLKYCIVEADAVEEAVEPVPEETPTTDEPTSSEENQES